VNKKRLGGIGYIVNGCDSVEEVVMLTRTKAAVDIHKRKIE